MLAIAGFPTRVRDTVPPISLDEVLEVAERIERKKYPRLGDATVDSQSYDDGHVKLMRLHTMFWKRDENGNLVMKASW